MKMRESICLLDGFFSFLGFSLVLACFFRSNKLLPTDPSNFTDKNSVPRKCKEDTHLPEGWYWFDDWTISRTRPADENGWFFCSDFANFFFKLQKGNMLGILLLKIGKQRMVLVCGLEGEFGSQKKNFRLIEFTCFSFRVRIRKRIEKKSIALVIFQIS